MVKMKIGSFGCHVMAGAYIKEEGDIMFWYMDEKYYKREDFAYHRMAGYYLKEGSVPVNIEELKGEL